MATSNDVLGITSPVPMGDWQSTVLYKKLNIVKYNGTTYIAKKDNQDFQPETTSGWQEVWMGIADKGATGDKGQQGASIFHTMAASSTSVAISSLQPQLTPSVGDGVVFPNGDVRQITAVGSTVTLGEVLFSFKGDAGIGNATLSNIDGDSTENGFTQAAVKGVAQAKNYYNLGVFDTYVSNGDGTGTVTRKTGIKQLEDITWHYDQASGKGRVYSSSFDTTEIICNVLPLSDNTYIGEQGIQYSVAYKQIQCHINGLTNLSQYIDWFKKNNAIIYYVLPTEYQFTDSVIENQPIHTLPQVGELWLDKEWRKGLNLCNPSAFIKNEYVSSTDGAFISSPNDVRTDYIVPTNRIYYFSILNKNSNFSYFRVSFFNNNKSYISAINVTPNSKVTLPNNCEYIVLSISQNIPMSTSDVAGLKIMFNKGEFAYPYEPYYGGIVRENQVPLYTSTDSRSPAQTIGGDWESKGSYTTSDGTTIYVWRKL